MKTITAWYLHGITSDELPGSLDELRKRATQSDFTSETLLKTEKWDFLIRKGMTETSHGFVPLRNLASTKRGIATGANEFFHVPAPAAAELRLPSNILVPCVGRAADVTGFEFDDRDFKGLIANGRRVYLLTFGHSLTSSERSYIATAEANGIHGRYLLVVRKPWYAMETQRPAPIWAVFE